MSVYMLLNLVCLISYFQAADASPTCHLGELSHPYTFTCDVGGNCTGIVWGKSTGKLAYCTQNICNTITNGYDVSASGRTSSLTIRNVTTLDMGIYYCEVDENFFVYNFSVFGTPEHVRCRDAEFHADTSTISLACTVGNVYPYPSCQFVWLLNETKSKETHEGRVDYTIETGSANQSYFNVNCSLGLRAQDFQLGSHSFYLSVDQGVIGCKNHNAHRTNSTRTTPRYVVYPKPILESCPETFVEEGQQFTCTCRDTANSFILPAIALIYGSTSVSSSLPHLTTNFTVHRHTQEIKCRAQLPDGTTTTIRQTFTVTGPVVNGSHEMTSYVLNVGGLAGGVVASAVAIPIIICIVIRMAREGWCSPMKVYRLTHSNTEQTRVTGRSHTYLGDINNSNSNSPATQNGPSHQDEQEGQQRTIYDQTCARAVELPETDSQFIDKNTKTMITKLHEQEGKDDASSKAQ